MGGWGTASSGDKRLRISNYANNIELSATLAAGTRVKKLKAQGVRIHDFTLGEPDFNTPAHIQEAARKAAADGHTHYTAAAGIPALRQAICDYHRLHHGLEYRPENVCVSSGCKHTIHSALAAVLNPGDEVVIPAPYWVSYSDLVKMTGAVPVVVPTTAETGFKMSAEQLDRAITAKTALLMLNSPCNPTGAVYTPAELHDLADVVVQRNITVMSDEIYDRLLYGDTTFQAFATLRPDLYERTLTVNGVSKTYAMTGWRIGWTCGPVPIVQAMETIQSQETGSSCSVSQYAALAGLTGDQECVTRMHTEFARRREFVSKMIPAIRGLKMSPPDGAFYAFFDVSSHFGKTIGDKKIANSADFCMAALDVAHVATVPGSAFGAEGFVRMSFATDMATIEAGLTALKTWLDS